MLAWEDALRMSPIKANHGRLSRVKASTRRASEPTDRGASRCQYIFPATNPTVCYPHPGIVNWRGGRHNSSPCISLRRTWRCWDVVASGRGMKQRGVMIHSAWSLLPACYGIQPTVLCSQHTLATPASLRQTMSPEGRGGGGDLSAWPTRSCKKLPGPPK